MKILFVDHLEVGGGLSRFSYMLCKSLVELDNGLHIDYLVHDANLRRTPELASLSKIRLQVLATTRPPSILKRITKKLSSRLGIYAQPSVMDEIRERAVGYDLAYFPSAHMMEYPALPITIVGTVHDFNWKYFFGRQIFSTDFVEKMNVEIVKWLNSASTVCSSQDVVTEAKKLFPKLQKFPEVIHIAPVVFSNDIDINYERHTLESLNINYPYLLFPGNFFPHKNHLNLFAAFALLKKRKGFLNLKLILTGIGSDQIRYGIATAIGVELVDDCKNYDVRGMGYQPNSVIDVLIKNATLVVSPSLYEAICTPGMDAWCFATPTAISDIPPFREHEQVWGIRSAFFNPTDPSNIADVLEGYLNNYFVAKEDALISQRNLGRYTWRQVAEKYYQVFSKAVKK